MNTGGFSGDAQGVELGENKENSLKDLMVSILPSQNSLNACHTCGACSSGCPASGLAGMDPRKFVRMISLGMDKEILETDWVWMCTICNRCVHACPMSIDIPAMVLMVRGCRPEHKLPERMVELCKTSFSTDTCSSVGMDSEDYLFIMADEADEIRDTQPGFEEFAVPVNRVGARFFLNQNSHIPYKDPAEMSPLWKILYLAGADWTCSSKGWASENYCMFLSRIGSWEKLVRKKAKTVDGLRCSVLLDTENGHDLYAVRQGLEMFGVPHGFEVKSIIEYYARWIRQGRLKVNADWNMDRKIKFTVQDPCQLVRKTYGDFIAEELRFVIKEAVGEENFVDMYPNRSNNYCCGGGGGAMEAGFDDERCRYGEIKLEQILDTGATYCITPCNNCHAQIRNLSRYYKVNLHAVHLWTILCLSLGVLGEKERKYLGNDLKAVGLQ